MDNFDLRKYLAENKLPIDLNENEQNVSPELIRKSREKLYGAKMKLESFLEFTQSDPGGYKTTFDLSDDQLDQLSASWHILSKMIVDFEQKYPQ